MPTIEQTPTVSALLARPFATIPDLIRQHASDRPTHPALILGGATIDYRALAGTMDQVASSLQREGMGPGDTIAICAGASLAYLTLYLGSLQAGVVVAPLAPTTAADVLVRMLADADAKLLFLDAEVDAALAPLRGRTAASRIRVEPCGDTACLDGWIAPAGSSPHPVAIEPDAPFNIIYSSGTTGVPKGVVQPCALRWAQVQGAVVMGYGPDSTTLIATPLYSNTTLVSVFSTLALGGTLVLMEKFDALNYLALAEQRRATHTMLVPVQYQRLLAQPQFDNFDLSAFRMKFCTSAPFAASLKAEVLRRWPGGLVELYGMTEGGGSCRLYAHEHPGKLHTVGRPAPGSEFRVIDEQGLELPPGATGEIVGRSASMMTGYHKQPEQTAEAEWYDAAGARFIRTGDVGQFDEDGFLALVDRKKDMIISGGFNIYPSDLEAVLQAHPSAVEEVAVAGVPSERWGETPVAFVVPRANAEIDTAELLVWANERLGKMQRLSAVVVVDALPRSAIGKVLKRELRDRYQRGGAETA